MSVLIDPDGGTGYDYLSLSAWEAAAVDADAICTSSGGSADTTDFTLNAFSGAATITAQAGDEAVKSGWDASRYRLDTNQISLASQAGVVVTGLQVRCTTVNGYDRTISQNTADTCDYINCRIHHDDTADQVSCEIVMADGSSVQCNLINCIVLQESANGEDGINFGGSAGGCVYNCIVYHITGGDAIESNNNTVRVKNCAVFNNLDDFQDTFTEIVNCASDDGDGTDPIAPSGSDWDNEFNDVSTYDFTLLTGGNLEGAGLDLSSDSDYPFSDDIDGDTRSDWDIGVDEIASAGVSVEPGVSQVSITGYAPTVSVTAHVTVTPGVSEEAVTGYAPTVTASDHQTVTPGVSETTITGYAPTVTVTAHVTATPGVSALTLTGYAPTVSTTEHVSVTPGVSQITITGYAPIVSATGAVTATPGVSGVTVTGYAPTVTVTAHVSVTPGVSQVAITGYAPIVTATGAVTTTPGASQTTLTGFAPTVSVTAHVTATPGASALSITGYAPTVTATDHISVTPGVAEVAFTGLAPTVTTSAHVTATPGTAQIVFTGYAPVVTAAGNNVTVTPGVASLLFTGYAPTVSVALGPRVTVSIPAQSRTLSVASQSRSLSVASQSRTLTIPDQDEGA